MNIGIQVIGDFKFAIRLNNGNLGAFKRRRRIIQGDAILLSDSELSNSFSDLTNVNVLSEFGSLSFVDNSMTDFNINTNITVQ